LVSDSRQDSTLVAALGYLPLLFLVPLVVRRDDPFARFHALQSLVLLVALLAAQLCILLVDLVVGRVLGSVLLVGYVFQLLAWLVRYPVGIAAALAYVVISVLCMVQAASGRYYRIPVLAAYVDRLRDRTLGSQQDHKEVSDVR
jgi:uncharacterized membrane protein